MVFFVPAVLLAAGWISSVILHATAAYPTSGPVVWIADATTAVVAECYPLSVQFTSPVAPQNISFFYYVGVQSRAGQRTVEFGSWPESQWVDASTVFTASSQSVPVAAGSMIALRVMDYNNTPSYLLEITVQPNTDASCITSADQQGAADYNYYPRESATTTVSPQTLAVSGGGASTDTAGASTDTAGASPGTTDPASKSPTATGASTASSSTLSSSASPGGTSASSLASQSTDSAVSSLTPVAANAPPSTGTSSFNDLAATSKHSATAVIAGAVIAALVALGVAAGTLLWFVRRKNRRRMIEARNRAAAPYDVAPPPIREVDAGRFDPERLPPQYEDISGSDSSAPLNSRIASGKGARPHPNLNYL